MIGIDVISIDRIKRFKDRFGEKALKKFLDDEEINFAKSNESIAGFWAAKEAVSKALGLGICAECGFFDIKLFKDKNNKPSFLLSKRLIEKYKIVDLDISITHDEGFAIAVAHLTSLHEEKKQLFFDK